MNQFSTFLAASIAPVLIFLYLINKKDKNKEPYGLLLKCFFAGFIVAAISIFVELILGIAGDELNGPLSKSVYTAFIVAALTEEFFKWIFIKKIIWKNAHFDEHYDGIIYAVFVSLGFALIENIAYVFSGGLHVAFARAVLAVPGHGLFAVMMGYQLSLAKFGPKENQSKRMLLSLLLPILFHGLYDFALMYMDAIKENNPLLIIGLILLFTFVVIRMWIVGIKNIKHHLHKDSENMSDVVV